MSLKTSGQKTGRKSRGCVLVVEDDEAIREAFQDLLTLEGYEVLLAYDGLHGLERLCEQIPHLILLDIRMPRLDGHAFLSRCRDVPSWATIPVVVLSATQRERPRGVRAFMSKPCDPRALLNVIAECLGEEPQRELVG